MISSSEFKSLISTCMDLFYKFDRESFDDYFIESLNETRILYKKLKNEMDYLSSFPLEHIQTIRKRSDPQYKDCPYPEDMLENARDLIKELMAVCKLTDIKYEFVRLDSEWFKKGKYAFFKLEDLDITELITLEYEKD